jgi:hypothetical protein
MTKKPTEPKIGDKMPDHTIYAGVSSKTGNQLFIPDPDHKAGSVPEGHGRPLMTFDEVQEALKNLTEHGHHFRLPTN